MNKRKKIRNNILSFFYLTAGAILAAFALEEFLISGCCIQRVENWHEPGEAEHVRVDNVNVNKWFAGTMNDTRAWDCELIGQLHDLNIAQLLRRVAGGNQRKAAWVRRLYTDGAESRQTDFTTRLGADSQLGSDFWHARDGKCRAIEVWTCPISARPGKTTRFPFSAPPA